MTIKIPEPGVLDYLLKAMGKKRGVRIAVPGSTAVTTPYSYSIAIKESFWRALMRPGTAELPDGMTDLFALHEPDRK